MSNTRHIRHQTPNPLRTRSDISFYLLDVWYNRNMTFINYAQCGMGKRATECEYYDVNIIIFFQFYDIKFSIGFGCEKSGGSAPKTFHPAVVYVYGVRFREPLHYFWFTCCVVCVGVCVCLFCRLHQSYL